MSLATSSNLISCNRPEYVTANSDAIECKVWFKTPRLKEAFLEGLSCIRLTTTAHGAGSDSLTEGGNASWFELLILDSPESEDPLVTKEEKKCVWRSHHNTLANEDTAINGQPFYKEDDLLQLLKPENVLAVRLCASPGWTNLASRGQIEFWHEKKDDQLLPSPSTPTPEDKKQTQLDIFKMRIEMLLTEYLQLQQRQIITSEMGQRPDKIAQSLMSPGSKPEEKGLGGRALRLLSIDGGGVRGISSLVILQNIMRKLTDTPDVKPCDYFDMICGTNTGGLIALMLGRLRMTIPDCITLYEEFARKIFKRNSTVSTALKQGIMGSAYSATTFESELKAIVNKYSMEAGDHMIPKPTDHHCKVFVVAVEAENPSKPQHIRTYKSANSDKFEDIPIWQAARATSAAPTYLPSITINGVKLVDGGVMYNNPVVL
ncbi:hypothetical protein EYR38_007355 [Pleurotus pulmonarius]|nr:hypothetical protein EYR38_007355 [Pleurotus pulmonarius]